MITGASQIEITPEVGCELSGFARRVQPSVGILDPLFARALYLVDGNERLLWIHADLIGVEREFVIDVRRWAHERAALSERQVIVSATHTHSGPGTIRIQEAGAYDPPYVERLRMCIIEAAERAMARTEPCDVVIVEGRCDLAVDRRRKAESHTDPRVAGVGLRRCDGTFAAVIVNYAMHAVALGPINRMISADIPGQLALSLSERLPGRPVVLATNGACGNLNPPAENVPFPQVVAWGRQVADAVAGRLASAPIVPGAALRTASETIPLPLDAMDESEIEAYAKHVAQDNASLAEWGDTFRRAVEGWRRTMVEAVRSGRARNHRDAELFAVCFGDAAFLGVNAEVFSRFADAVRERTGRLVYVVGYANGDMGYLPTREAYGEGGYEVEIAHLFYNNFRPQAGALELLMERAAQLTRALCPATRGTLET